MFENDKNGIPVQNQPNTKQQQTTAAQTSITSVGTLGSLSVTGNVQGGNLRTAGLISATGTITGSSLTGTITTAAQPTITSVGTLTALAVSNSTVSSWVAQVTGGTLGNTTGNQVLLSRLNSTNSNQNFL